jgi:hypothetical protein
MGGLSPGPSVLTRYLINAAIGGRPRSGHARYPAHTGYLARTGQLCKRLRKSDRYS